MNWMQRFMLTRTLSMLAVMVALGLWLFASPARAALVTVSNSASSGNSPSTVDPTTLVLHQLDVAPGALKLVRLQFTALGLPGVPTSLRCEDPDPCGFQFAYDFTLSLLDFSFGEIEFVGQADRRTGIVSCTADPGDRCRAGQPPTANLAGDDSSADPATLALFAGTGTFSLSFNSLGSGNPRTAASATVTYVYDDSLVVQLPEPGTLAAASLALLALAGTARTRRPRRA